MGAGPPVSGSSKAVARTASCIKTHVIMNPRTGVKSVVTLGRQMTLQKLLSTGPLHRPGEVVGLRAAMQLGCGDQCILKVALKTSFSSWTF